MPAREYCWIINGPLTIGTLRYLLSGRPTSYDPHPTKALLLECAPSVQIGYACTDIVQRLALSVPSSQIVSKG